MTDPGDILTNLNPRQREAVTHLQGPCLVLAGPGSGKTRVITHRAAFLVAAQGIPPDQILAVTFTNKAAQEMRLRLEKLLGVNVQGMWVCTFHAAALRLLREFAAEAGLRPDFVVWDEVAQQEALEEALRRLDLSRELWGVANLHHWLSLAKGALRDPTQPDLAEDPANAIRARVAEIYGQVLREAGALDFDDLIVRAVQLLSTDRTVRQTVQARFQHVLVDELQDINRAQYQFLKLLAPPPVSHVLAVADDDQSIYGWRGSDFRFIEWFKRDYRARVVELDQSYRSTESILAAAREMIQRDARRSRRPLRAREPGGHPIHHYLFQTAQGEIVWLPRLIQRLVEREGYQYRDIAILYRIHRLGEPIERALFEAGIPLQRIQKDPFFARPQAREVVRYLRLLRGFTNEDVAGALNFPRTLADELTMIQLRRLATDNQVSLLELARRADDFPEISPLTRARLRAFLHDLDEDLRPLADEDISRIVEALFRVLERRRSPFSQDDQPLLDGFAAFVDFSEEGERLRRAVDAGRPMAIVAPATVDGACAAVVLEQTLANYLGQTAVLYLVDAQTSEVPIDFGSLAAVPIILGEGTADLVGLDPAEVDARGGVMIAGQDRGSLRYSLSTLAWRLAQGLLLAYERLDQERFVIYDLETTGVDPRQDDIVEIAAQVVEGGAPAGPRFYSLVRPAHHNFIPKEASEVHGITWADVEDAPAIETVLPAFLRYVEGATVVGHNILEFDNRFIDREMGRILQRGFYNPSVDTLELSRRLLHEESHSLEHLVSRLGLGKEQEHRAAEDVEQTHALFRRLMEENRRQVGLSALSELLPLVAGGILASGVPIVDENAALVAAGARVTARHAAGGNHVSDLWARVAQVLGPDRAWGMLDAPARGPIEKAAKRTEERAGASGDAPARGPIQDDDVVWTRLREDFVRAVADFEAYSSDRSLDAFLGYQALATSEDTYDPTADKVTLMTLHNAKGTEFKVVIIIGVDHGLIPLWTVEGDVWAVAEERRVFYVGMTRAKERLYLFSARERGDGFNRPPCQFALELPAEHVVRVEPGRRQAEVS